jgi:23S rRNA pseudouridine2605 synthase
MTRSPGAVPLARALSKLGVASRKDATAMIRGGRVSVDGRIALDPGLAVVPERARIALDGEPARRVPAITVMLHKPRGVVTTARDPGGRPTVLDLVRDLRVRVVPVGRLDLATTGLLLLTSDTRLADWITDPRHAVPRTYATTVRGEVSDEQAARLRQGIESGGERLQASRLDVRKRSGRETHLVVTLTQGRNREVRRLFEAVGHEVTRLKRTAFGGLSLGALRPGTWRRLSADELLAAFPGAPLRAPREARAAARPRPQARRHSPAG